jgi:integrase
MDIHKLSARFVAIAPVGMHGDGGMLWLRVTPGAGGKLSRRFTFRYQRGDQYLEVPIGKFPDVALAAARERASEYRAALAANRDPAQERRDNKKARREAEAASRVAEAEAKFTFKRAALEYAANIGEQRWRSARVVQAFASNMRDSVFPHIGEMPLAVIDHAAALRVLDPLSESSVVMMHKVRGWCENVFAYGAVRMAKVVGMALDKPNPFAWDKLKFVYSKKPTSEHFKTIDWRTLPALCAQLVERGDDPAAMAVRLAILLALRPGEARLLRFDQIDTEDNTITLPMTKNGKPFTTYITPPVAEILERAAALRAGDHVFPGRSNRAPLGQRALYARCAAMTGGASVHATARASFSSWAYSTQSWAPDHVIEMTLNHSVGDSTVRAYRRIGSGAELQRRLLTAWGDFVTGRAASNVLPFPAPAAEAASA